MKRFNIEVIPVETGEEVQHLYLTQQQVMNFIRAMHPGTDIIVHRVVDSQEGHLL